MRSFTSDGVVWGVGVKVPGVSNAMLVFRHPGGSSARKDRYAWYNAPTPESRNVTTRLDPAAVLASISDLQLARLFRRSMLVSATDNPLSRPIAGRGA